MPYVVKILNTEAEVTWMGMDTALPLVFADGMIGVMPVFATKEQARAYAGDEYGIAEIATSPPNTK